MRGSLQLEPMKLKLKLDGLKRIVRFNIGEILQKLDSNISELVVKSDPNVSDVFKQLEKTIDTIEKDISIPIPFLRRRNDKPSIILPSESSIEDPTTNYGAAYCSIRSSP